MPLLILTGNITETEKTTESIAEMRTHKLQVRWKCTIRLYWYCTMLGYFNPTMTPNVQSRRFLTTLRYVYVICHCWTPICNVLGYWWHRSICYTSLFTTPLVVTTIFLLQCVMTLWCRVSERSFDIFCYLFDDLASVTSPHSVSLLSLSLLGVSSMSVCLSDLYLFSSLCLLSCPSNSVCAWNRRHLPSRLHFRCSSFATIWLLGKLQIRTRPLSSNVHFWSTAKSVTILLIAMQAKFTRMELHSY
jgi:hypothetical protein